MEEGRLYVRNLDFSVTNEDLRDMVSPYGELRHAERVKGALGLSHHRGRIVRVYEARLRPETQSSE